MHDSSWLLHQARHLRRQSTDAERCLWHHLRGRRLLGFKFRRQVPVGSRIVDFLCLEAKLIVEADGGQHMVRRLEDEQRTVELERRDYRVLRFWNHQILQETDAVLEEIGRALRRSF